MTSGGAPGVGGAAAPGARPAPGPTAGVGPTVGTGPRPAAKPAKAAKPARATRVSARAGRPPRLASLTLRRIDPWTTLKISLIVSIVMFFVWMIAVGVLYLSLDTLDVWRRINDTYNTLVVSPEAAAAAGDLITPGTVFGVTAAVGAINIVLFTALSAVFAFIYNAAAGMAGGVEITLSEHD